MKYDLEKFFKYAMTAIFVIVIFIAYSPTNLLKAAPNTQVQLDLDEPSFYPEVVKSLLPSSVIVTSNNNSPYFIIDNGAVAQSYDMQALPAVESEIIKYWYPHYLATVIIALDNDQSDEVIYSWTDLLKTENEVGVIGDPLSLQMQVAAMAYGLEGENYTLNKAIDILSTLYDKNLLKMNSTESPITICFDYQAVALIEAGRNLSIIIPSEGTFTYQKGLLSNQKLTFINKGLIDSNLRGLDGKSKNKSFPSNEKYINAVKVSDISHYSDLSQHTSHLVLRNVLKTNQIMSIDNHEHLMFALIYLIYVTMWTVTAVYRSTQKSISFAALSMGIILGGWTLVRLVKYQVIGIPLLTRYLWYSFYFFQLSLPLIILWMAWTIDKPKEDIMPPRWWKVLVILVSLLIILVFTNDWHNLVLKLDLSRYDWDINYGYGTAYYVVLVICMSNITLAFLIMLKKSIKNPRKRGFIVPLLLFILFGIYNYKYIVRDPLVFHTDVTIITGLFAILMFEACIRFGLIPVNTKYIDLFKRSPIKLQIFNNDKELVMASSAVEKPKKRILNKIFNSLPVSVISGNSLVFANPIIGGFAVWYEDMSEINTLHKKLQDSSKMLQEANELLSKEEKIKRSINEQLAKKELVQQFESEVATSIEKLNSMVSDLDGDTINTKGSTRIALLLMYIKRRSNLFFINKKTAAIEIEQLLIYIDELSKIANFQNSQVATINEIKTTISCRQAALLYQFFYEVLNQTIEDSTPFLINYLEGKDDFITMRLLPSKKIKPINFNPKFWQAVEDNKGFIVSKNVDDTIGISLSFSKGGLIND